MTKRSHVADLRGASKLAIDATRGVTSLVEAMHATIASGPAILGAPLAGPAKLATGVVYGSIRGVTTLVGAGIDLALAALAPLLDESTPGDDGRGSPAAVSAAEGQPGVANRDAVLSAVNGVLGDYLHEHANPLAIEMSLRHRGRDLELAPDRVRAAIPDASRTLVVLVHGLCMNDRQWLRREHDHGAALARDLGATAIYARYNTGLHIAANGRELAHQLDDLVAAWPVAIDQLVVIGHSMGGLVGASACHVGGELGMPWRALPCKLITLGSPHHGAPLERGGSWIDLLLGVSRYSAPFGRLARIRSAGITDLRYGHILDAHHDARGRFVPGRDRRGQLALPAGVRCYAIAGALAKAPSTDGLVPVASALGTHREPALALAFADHEVVAGTDHLELLASPAVYAAIARWVAA